MHHQLTIRQSLRNATAPLHDRLDQSLGAFDLADRVQLARFLSVQLAAREPIEGWVAANAPAGFAPPPQSPLIRADLRQLGHPPQAAPAAFDLPAAAAPGVAWALGGSSLGNRTMLAALRKRGAGVPTAFLADPAMPAFFARLRPLIERPADDPSALTPMIAGARAVFARFIALVPAALDRAAA